MNSNRLAPTTLIAQLFLSHVEVVGTFRGPGAASVCGTCSTKRRTYDGFIYDDSGLAKYKFEANLQSNAQRMTSFDGPHHLHHRLCHFQVEPRTEECFYEDLKAGDKFLINFEVIRGGLLDIEYKMKDPHSNIIYQRLAFFNHKCAPVNFSCFKQSSKL